MPSAFANVARDGYRGTTVAYKIEGGKLVIPVAQGTVLVHVLQTRRHLTTRRAATSFGYANYEIIPPPQIAANPLTEVSNQFSIQLG